MADLGSMVIHLTVDNGQLLTTEVSLRNLGQAAEKTAAKSKKSFGHMINMANMYAQRIRTIGYLTSAVLTAPIIASGKAILDATKDFEFSMQKIVGLVGVAQGTVDEWKQSLLDMSVQVAKTPKELAEGLYFLTSSGIEGAEALEVLEISAKAATAGLGQTQEVADLLSSALNAYAGTGLTAANAADILVAAVREGKGEADAFARSMGQIIPIAANLGVSFDQVAGAMAAMTLTGSSAANAAVYLKGVFNALMTANDQGAKVLDRAETSYAELRDILESGPEGLINVLQKFRDIQMQLGDEAIKDVLPNIRALTGFMSVAGKNFQYNTKIMREITNATGAMNAAFLAVEDTLKVRLDRALASVQASMIRLGVDIAPTIIKVLEGLVVRLDRLTDRWNNLSDAQKRFRLAMVGVLAAIGPFALLASSLIYVLTGLGQLVVGLGKGIAAFLKFAYATATSRAALTAFNLTGAKTLRVVSTLVGTLGMWGVAIGLLVAGYIKLRKARKEAEEALPSAMDTTAIDPLKEELKVIREGDFSYESIEGKMDLLSKMDITQLQELRNTIGTRIQLEKDFRIKLMQIREQGLEDDEKILKRRSLIDSLYNDILKKQESLSSGIIEKGSEPYKAIEGEITTLKNRISGLRTEISAHKEEMMGWIDTMISDIPKATEKFEEMGKRVDEELKALGMSQQEIESLHQALTKYNEALEGIKDTYKSEVAYLDFMAKNARKLGIEFDYLGEKTDVLKGILEDLTKLPEGAIGTEFAKNIISQLENLPANLYPAIQALENLQDEFKFLDLKAKIDLEFDVNAEKISTLEDVRDDLIEIRATAENLDKTFIIIGTTAYPAIMLLDAAIRQVTGDIKLYENAQQESVDTKTLALLNAEADAFGNIAGKVTVLEYQLRAAKRELRKLLQEQISGDAIIPDEVIKRAVKGIQDIEISLQRMRNALDIKYFEDMYYAMDNVSRGMDLLNAKIRQLEDELRYLSEQNLEGSASFEILIGKLRELEAAEAAVDMLSNAFDSFFDGVIDGSRDMSEILEGIFKQIIKDIAHMITKMILFKIAMAIVGPAAIGANTLGKIGINIAGIAGMQKGGIVPPGYPNDTYLARLTSGEMVIPKDGYKNTDPLKRVAKANITPTQGLDHLGPIQNNVHVTIDGKIKNRDIALVIRRIQNYN